MQILTDNKHVNFTWNIRENVLGLISCRLEKSQTGASKFGLIWQIKIRNFSQGTSKIDLIKFSFKKIFVSLHLKLLHAQFNFPKNSQKTMLKL